MCFYGHVLMCLFVCIVVYCVFTFVMAFYCWLLLRCVCRWDSRQCVATISTPRGRTRASTCTSRPPFPCKVLPPRLPLRLPLPLSLYQFHVVDTTLTTPLPTNNMLDHLDPLNGVRPPPHTRRCVSGVARAGSESRAHVHLPGGTPPARQNTTGGLLHVCVSLHIAFCLFAKCDSCFVIVTLCVLNLCARLCFHRISFEAAASSRGWTWIATAT